MSRYANDPVAALEGLPHSWRHDLTIPAEDRLRDYLSMQQHGVEAIALLDEALADLRSFLQESVAGSPEDSQ